MTAAADWEFITRDRSILCLPQDQWKNGAIAYFESNEYRTNPDHVRFLVWRNLTVHSLNRIQNDQPGVFKSTTRK